MHVRHGIHAMHTLGLKTDDVNFATTRVTDHKHNFATVTKSSFSFPDKATVHTYPGKSTANLEKINPLFRVERNKSVTSPITCGRVNPDIFESDDVMSSLSPNNETIWRHDVEGEQSKISATISLYGACSEDILVQRSLGY